MLFYIYNKMKRGGGESTPFIRRQLYYFIPLLSLYAFKYYPDFLRDILLSSLLNDLLDSAFVKRILFYTIL
ncbi:hypothetical protein CW304_04815 [Bacillus sp. UFRGS-B20]|nr:hypothetical protein CW304_04815 [Bacillus sp. UFRGS-B20]